METRSERLAYLDKPLKSELTEDAHEDYIAVWKNLLQDRPGYVAVNEALLDFESLNSKQKERYARQYVRRWYDDPELFRGTMYELQRRADQKDDRSKARVQQHFSESITKELQKIGRLEAIDSSRETHIAAIQSWLDAYMNSDGLRESAGALLRSFFTQPYTEEGVKQLIQNLHGMVTVLYDDATSNEVRQELLRIFSFQTDILPSNRPYAELFLAGGVSTDMPTALRYADLDIAITSAFERHAPDLLTAYEKGMNSVIESPTEIPLLRSMIEKLHDTDSPEAKVIIEFQELIGRVRREQSVPSDIENKLTRNPIYRTISDPKRITALRKNFLKLLATYGTEASDHDVRVVYVPGVGISPQSIKRGTEVNKEYLRRQYASAETESVDDTLALETLARAIGVDRIQTDKEYRDAVMGHVTEMKRVMKYEARCLVTPRGDTIRIPENSDFYAAYGVSQITFQPDTSVTDLVVSVRVGNIDTRLRLTDQFQIRNVDNKPISLAQAEMVALERVICTTLKEIVTATGSSGDMVGKKSETVSTTSETPTLQVRRPHMRKLQTGHTYSLAQAALAERDYGVDLVRYNSDRRSAPEDPYFTFVTAASIMFEAAKALPPLVRTLDLPV
jgi:hypothetical protein